MGLMAGRGLLRQCRPSLLPPRGAGRAFSSAPAGAAAGLPALRSAVPEHPEALQAALAEAAGPLHEFLATGPAFSPVNLAAQALEGIHVLTGSPWPASIILFTLGMRAALFPLAAMQTRSSVAANNLKPAVDRLRSDAMGLKQSGDTEGARRKLRELAALMKTNRIGVGRLLGLGLAPLPFFMSTFFAIRNMAAQPVASLVDGGWLWFADLTAADPYYILPVATTLSLLLSLEASRFMNPNANTPMMKMFMRSMTLISLPVTAFMPSALVFYFLVSNLATAGIQLLWRVPFVRAWFQIALPVARPAQPSAPSAGFAENFMAAYRSALNEPAPNKQLQRDIRRALRKQHQPQPAATK